MQLLEQNEGVRYVVRLSPGVVSYLNFEWFLRSDPEEAIKELRTLSSNLEITSPKREIRIYLDRTRGSHRQFKHPHKRGLVTIAGKPNDDLAPGTKNSILKQSGLK
jgi:predicted RNA binding protein YcfA (HicA-like mRNA interferase family)